MTRRPELDEKIILNLERLVADSDKRQLPSVVNAGGSNPNEQTSASLTGMSAVGNAMSVIPSVEKPFPENTSSTKKASSREMTLVAMVILLVYGFKRFEYTQTTVDHFLLTVSVNIVFLSVLSTQWRRLKSFFGEENSRHGLLAVLLLLLTFCAIGMVFIGIKAMLLSTHTPLPSGFSDCPAWLSSAIGIGWLAVVARYYFETLPPHVRKRFSSRRENFSSRDNSNPSEEAD